MRESAVLLLGGRTPEASNTWEVDARTLPVCVLAVRSHAEALSILGSRPRVVAASVWTEDGTLAPQVASALKVSCLLFCILM